MNTVIASGLPETLRDQSGGSYQVCFTGGLPASGSWQDSFTVSNVPAGVTVNPVWDGSCVTFEITATAPGNYSFDIGMTWACGGDPGGSVSFLALTESDGLPTPVEYIPGTNNTFTPVYSGPCTPYTLQALNPQKDSVPSWVFVDPANGQITINSPAGEFGHHFIEVMCQDTLQAVLHLQPATDFEALDGAALNNLKKYMPWGGTELSAKETPINGEPQYYTYDGDTGLNPAFTTSMGYNPHIDNGTYLAIQASESNAADRLNNRLSNDCNGNQAPYVSGVLTGEDIYEQDSGRWQLDVKFPVGPGYFGGFWFIGTDLANGNEGPPPEYGIEWSGNRPNEVWFNIHHPTDGVIPSACQAAGNYELYSLPWNHSPSNTVTDPSHPDYNPCEVEKHTSPPPGGWRPGGFQFDTLPGGRRIDQWNTYALEIRGGRAYFEVNGVCMADGQAVTSTPDAMQLFPIINLALSDQTSNCGILNGFIDPIDSTTLFPAQMEVRNLKIWSQA